MHAPGHVHPSDHWRVGHHVLLAHAAAVQRFRHLVPNGRISLNANTDYAEPLTDSQEDKVCCLRLVAGVKDSQGAARTQVQPLTNLNKALSTHAWAA